MKNISYLLTILGRVMRRMFVPGSTELKAGAPSACVGGAPRGTYIYPLSQLIMHFIELYNNLQHSLIRAGGCIPDSHAGRAVNWMTSSESSQQANIYSAHCQKIQSYRFIHPFSTFIHGVDLHSGCFTISRVTGSIPAQKRLQLRYSVCQCSLTLYTFILALLCGFVLPLFLCGFPPGVCFIHTAQNQMAQLDVSVTQKWMESQRMDGLNSHPHSRNLSFAHSHAIMGNPSSQRCTNSPGLHYKGKDNPCDQRRAPMWTGHAL